MRSLIPAGRDAKQLIALVAVSGLLAACDSGRTTRSKDREIPETAAPSFAVSAGQTATFFVHAHEDDWQLFMGDQTPASLSSATQLTFVYTDAGDANRDVTFWTTRERAAQASMDTLIGSVGTWTCGTQTVNAHPIRRCVRGKVVTYWMRLPDGATSGEGWSGRGSMLMLENGQQSTITAIDGSTTYASWTDLWQTIRGIIDLESASQSAPYVTVHAPEWDRTTNINDHPDHLATGDAVRAAAATRSWNLVWYIDYYTEYMPVNLDQAGYDLEQRLFYAYDNTMGAAGYGRNQYEAEYQAWLWRSYHRAQNASNTAPSAPTSLTANAASMSEIDLAWADNAGNETGYYVERAPDNSGAPGTFSLIATLGANATTYANTSLAASTRYWYRVRAYNGVGTSAYSNNASATTAAVPPATPTNLAVQAASSSQLNLSWTDNATNESGYYVERAPDVSGAPGTFAQIASLAANATSYNNTGLTPSTRYWYRVRAYNATDVSAYSSNAVGLTLDLPATPTGLAATAASATQIDLAWADNATNETGYYVERAPDVSGAPGTFAQIATLAANATTYSNTGLTTATRYWYRVRAFNTTDVSAYSANASATTLTIPPAAPSGLAASMVSSSQINLAWADNATNETGYTVERAPDNNGVAGTYAQIASLAAGATSYSNTGLSAATTYWYRVRAFNATDVSAYSNETSATTQVAAPSAPTSLTATAASATQIDLAWTDNAINETGYTVERAPDVAGAPGTFAQIAALGADAVAYSNTGLAAGTRYWYRVRASNAGGSSAYSNSASATTLTIPPAAPSGLQATAASASQIDLSWADNASSETGYSIERAPDVSGAPGTFAQVATVGANVTTYSNSGLTAATTYWYRVRAFNATDVSGYSNDASATTSTLPVAAPSGLTATAAGTSQIDLAWTDNATNETGYTVERAPDVSGSAGTYAQIATLPGNSTSYNDAAGLTAGTRYWYRVRAFNATDVSSYSNQTSATTDVLPPAAPSGLGASAASASQIALSWTDNATNEAGYYVEQAPDVSGAAGTWTQVATLGANATSYNATGLSAGTTYWYRVRAYNASGNSGYSNEASATTQTVPPATPSGLAATAVSTSQIDLTWADNATNETGYTVERAPDVSGAAGTYAQIATLPGNSTSYNDNAGLSAGTRYWYRVRAFNAVDVSAYSNQASATTDAPPPAAPSGLGASAVSPSEIDLAWTDNASDETGYTVERAPDVGGAAGTYAWVATLAANATSYANTGLTASTRYWYRVRAFNGSTASGYSNETSATTQNPPPPATPSGLVATAISTSQINLTWADNATNETGYTVERAPDAGGVAGAYTAIATLAAGSTSYSNTGLTSATTYWYRVRAFDATDVSGYSNETSATTQTAAPSAPTNLTATAASSSQINLAWTDNATNETGYYVERAPDVAGAPGTFARIATLAAGAASYSDLGLSATTRYWYRVQAYNGGGTSAYSNQTSATTLVVPPAAPTGLAATVVSSVQINLAWTDNANNESGYYVERAPDAGGAPGTFVQIASLGAGVRSYSSTGLTGSTTYWYRVRAYNGGGTSAYTNTASGTTLAPVNAPTGLTATAVSTSRINLAWTDNATNETGYYVERAPDNAGVPGKFNQVATLVSGSTAFADTKGVKANKTYWYRVRAFNTTDVSPYSNTTSATTPR